MLNVATAPTLKQFAARLYFMQKHLNDPSISLEAKDMLKRSIETTKEYIVNEVMRQYKEEENIDPKDI